MGRLLNESNQKKKTTMLAYYFNKHLRIETLARIIGDLFNQVLKQNIKAVLQKPNLESIIRHSKKKKPILQHPECNVRQSRT